MPKSQALENRITVKAAVAILEQNGMPLKEIVNATLQTGIATPQGGGFGVPISVYSQAQWHKFRTDKTTWFTRSAIFSFCHLLHHQAGNPTRVRMMLAFTGENQLLINDKPLDQPMKEDWKALMSVLEDMKWQGDRENPGVLPLPASWLARTATLQ